MVYKERDTSESKVPKLNRRAFVKTLAVGGAALSVTGPAPAQPSGGPKIKLGIDNFSVRAMGWKADQLLDYAASLKLDTMFYSDLKVYVSHDDAYLKDLGRKARDLGVDIYAGTFSICPTSRSLTKDYGTPQEHLALGIRIAKAVGSPVLRCVTGNFDDRKVEGGIERQITEVVKVLKDVRSRALDAGVKIAIENHAGDTQGWEIAGLIEAAGKDFVGATMDSGNATWALEDPMTNLEALGPYALVTGIRDSSMWEYEDGIRVQWTAVGEGQTDWKAYVKRYAELCPQAPFVLEIISGFSLPFPYLKEDFWKPYPKAPGRAFAALLRMAKKGNPLESFKAPEGKDRRLAEQEYQKAELERSIKYCREVLGLGCKA